MFTPEAHPSPTVAKETGKEDEASPPTPLLKERGVVAHGILKHHQQIPSLPGRVRVMLLVASGPAATSDSSDSSNPLDPSDETPHT